MSADHGEQRFGEDPLTEPVLVAAHKLGGQVGATLRQVGTAFLGVQRVRDDLDPVSVLDERDRVLDVLPGRATLDLLLNRAAISERSLEIVGHQLALAHRASGRPAAEHQPRRAEVRLL